MGKRSLDTLEGNGAHAATVSFDFAGREKIEVRIYPYYPSDEGSIRHRTAGTLLARANPEPGLETGNCG